MKKLSLWEKQTLMQVNKSKSNCGKQSLDWRAWYLTSEKNLKEQRPSSPSPHTHTKWFQVGTMLGRAEGTELRRLCWFQRRQVLWTPGLLLSCLGFWLDIFLSAEARIREDILRGRGNMLPGGWHRVSGWDQDSATLSQRWKEYLKGKWEVLGGWHWVTPGRSFKIVSFVCLFVFW